MRGGGAPAQSAIDALVKTHPVTLYQTAQCDKPCNDGRQLLDRRGVPYRAVNVDSQEKLEELKKLSDAASVPVLVVGPTVIKGYDLQTWTQALDAAGYQSTAPATAVGPRAQPPASAAPVAAAKPQKAPAPKLRPDLTARLFVSDSCGQPCEDARNALSERGVSVNQISVSDPDGLEELQRISGGKNVPVTVVGQILIRGFNPAQYRDAIDNAP